MAEERDETERIQKKIVDDYMEGKLSPERDLAFQKHISGCNDCWKMTRRRLTPIADE